jgi:acetyl-CoA carboxylase carboxyl transferase subunit beta
LVDAVVDGAEQTRDWIACTLGLRKRAMSLPAGRPLASVEFDRFFPPSCVPAIQIVNHARSATRPSGVEWAAKLTSSWTEIAGVGCGVRSGLATLGRTRVVVIAMDRHGDSAPTSRLSTHDYRLARRSVELAGRWGVPLLTLVDTVGADPSSASENDGIAHEIAALFGVMSDAPIPTLSLCVGEGGSGGAMAFSHADASWILDDAFYSVIAPESAATILWHDAGRAAEAADDLALTAPRLRNLGVVDRVVAASEGAGGIADAIECELLQVEVGRRQSRLNAATASAVIER